MPARSNDNRSNKRKSVKKTGPAKKPVKPVQAKQAPQRTMVDHTDKINPWPVLASQQWLSDGDLATLSIPDSQTLKTNEEFNDMLKAHPELIRQMETRERIDRVKLQSIDPETLPKHLKPLEECVDGKKVWQFGVYRLARKPQNEGGTWQEPSAEGQLPLAAKHGSVELATTPSFDKILEDSLQVLEDEQQPAYVRHAARLVAGAIHELYCLGVNPQDPRLWLAVVAGGFYERMKVEQQQHHALEGRKVVERRQQGGKAPKKKDLWDRRCQRYRNLTESKQYTKHEICRQIAETEIKRKKGEGYRWPDAGFTLAHYWPFRVSARTTPVHHPYSLHHFALCRGPFMTG